MNFKRYTEGDEIHIVSLFERTFKKEMSLDFWRWRFLENPFNDDKFISLFWHEDQLIGHYAASPVELLVDGQVVKSALSMTTMTDPLYQGLGIFPVLANDILKALTESNYTSIWGFPNNNSHYGLINGLNWKDIGILTFLSLDHLGIGRLNEQRIDFISHTNFDNIDNTLFFDKSKSFQVNKSKAYLNWRYVMNPLNSYQIHEIDETILVYKVIPSFELQGKNEIDIVEMSNNINYATLKKHITHIVNFESKINRINVWQTIFQNNFKHFEKIGFKPSMPLTYFSFKELQDVDVSIYDLKNWNVSLGYSDVF